MGNGWIPGRKEKDKARQPVFPTPTNPFGNDLEEEELHDDYTVPQKVLYVTRWKHDQNAVHCVRLSRAQDQGLEFWQTKSFAIMTYALIPGDCIDRVTSQDGDRILFVRLETQRPAPKVTLKMNGHSQQHHLQHSTSDTHVPSLWKQDTKREDQAGAQDVTDHSTEADLAHRKLRHTSSNMDVDTQVNTHALLKDDAVKMNSQRRIQKQLKESKVVRTRFVFVMTWRKRRGCLASNPAKLSWVTWNSLN